jgi:hypothetical protein
MKVDIFITEYLVLFNVLACLFEGLYASDGIPKTITIPLRKYRDTNKTKEKRDVSESQSDISPKYHDNLSGRPGQGYYLAIQLGTPPQSVSFRNNFKRLKYFKNLMKHMYVRLI